MKLLYVYVLLESALEKYLDNILKCPLPYYLLPTFNFFSYYFFSKTDSLRLLILFCFCSSYSLRVRCY